MARKASTAKADKEISFEQALDKLEGIVDDLESGKPSLDQSLKLYEEGVKTLDGCHRILDRAEQKIQQLVRDSEGRIKAQPWSMDNGQ